MDTTMRAAHRHMPNTHRIQVVVGLGFHRNPAEEPVRGLRRLAPREFMLGLSTLCAQEVRYEKLL